jgi:dishevelled associated activator of morphogenesis
MEPKIVAVLEGSKEVARSKKLKKLLEIILALGNYMNRGQRGNAVGFRISSLNRLSDTKSSTKNTTLLHYLVDTLELKVFLNSYYLIVNKANLMFMPWFQFKDVLKLDEDLPHLKQASKVRYYYFIFYFAAAFHSILLTDQHFLLLFK